MTAIDGIIKGALLKESLRKGNVISVKLTGNCMEPFISEGTSLFVKATDFKSIRPGDVILFRDNDRVLAHRLFKKVRKDGNIFLKVKADSSISFDSLVSPDDLMGKVVSLENKGRMVSLANPMSSIPGLLISYIKLSIGCIKSGYILRSLRNRMRYRIVWTSR